MPRFDYEMGRLEVLVEKIETIKEDVVLNYMECLIEEECNKITLALTNTSDEMKKAICAGRVRGHIMHDKI